MLCSITLVCEEAEDMWHLYNLIRVGDTLRCSTVRKVVTESSTGTTSSQRVHTVLSICIETVDFDAAGCVLHLKGKNVVENEHVKMGAYHTLDVEIGRKFQLEKRYWDSIDLDRLNMALDPAKDADVAAVVMQEGLAHLCLLKPAMTIVRAKIDMQIPKKHKGLTSQHEKGMQRFYDALATAFMRYVDLKVVKCVILASRGFLNEHFLNTLLANPDRQFSKMIADNRSKFLLVHASSGFKHALKEVLADPGVAQALSNTKASEFFAFLCIAQGEVKALETFYALMANEPARAFYGYKHVMLANENLAIETLMVSDSLFRSNDIEQRRKYVALVESVKDQGCNVLIFSSMHVTGEQLGLLGGVAAILRFPLHELEEEDMSDSENEDDKHK
uniref:Protein pelota homolog n=1 Tax=Syphacia muris TaxID=451379 RepID=A0A0N5AI58_9BILA